MFFTSRIFDPDRWDGLDAEEQAEARQFLKNGAL